MELIVCLNFTLMTTLDRGLLPKFTMWHMLIQNADFLFISVNSWHFAQACSIIVLSWILRVGSNWRLMIMTIILNYFIGWETSGGSTLLYMRSCKIRVTMGKHVRKWRRKWHAWNSTCLEMDNAWWSLGFCDERTQISWLNKKYCWLCLRKSIFIQLDYNDD